MDFPPPDELPEGMTALNASLPSCCEGPLACSCGDCPGAKGCLPPPTPPEPSVSACALGGVLAWLTCPDIGWATLLAVVLLAGIPAMLRRRCRAAAAGVAPGPGTPGVGGLGMKAELVDYPLTETGLRRAFYSLGELCMLKPWAVIVVGLTAVFFLCLGLLALRVATQPEELWVGPRSQAAQEKRAYEVGAPAGLPGLCVCVWVLLGGSRGGERGG